MSKEQNFTDEDVKAWLTGKLDPSRTAEVKADLKSDTSKMLEVLDKMGDELDRLFNGDPDKLKAADSWLEEIGKRREKREASREKSPRQKSKDDFPGR